MLNGLCDEQINMIISDLLGEMNIDEKDAEHFDECLEKMDKKYQTSQEEFYIYSHSFVEWCFNVKSA